MFKKKKKKEKQTGLWPLTKTILLFFCIVIFLRASVVEAYKIPSGSMLPNLLIGDHILVTKFNFGIRFPFIKKSLLQYYQPMRGDIVVFTLPKEGSFFDSKLSFPWSDKNIIKRVIGLPGDVVEINNGQVFVNGDLLIEPYAVWIDGGNGRYGPYEVPENHVLLLGDNRDQSRDSRFWDNPYLDMKLLKGKALVIYFNSSSFDRIGKIIR